MRPRPVVWVVDDSALDAEVAKRALEGCYDVEVFTDGSAALDRLTTGRPPDALVLDWLMPDIDGVEIVRFLRGSSRLSLQELRVLLLTGQDNPEQVVEGLEAGANDYLCKPYEAVELSARVGALVRSKALADRVRAGERTIRHLLNEAPDALVAVDRRGRITWVNREAATLFGLSPNELHHRPVTDVLPELDWRRARAGGSLGDLDVGGRIWAPSVRVLDEPTVAGTVIALRDVTAKREADARRLDFYSMIAHDLRSPLQNMVLRSQLLARGRFGSLGEEVTLELHRITDHGREMVALIDDFLEIARFESLAHKLHRDPVDLAQVARDVCREYLVSAREKGVRLDVDFPSTPLTVLGDARRLRQVLVNLLTNAVKFTSAGGRIALTGRLDGDDCLVEVSDTGRGIAPALRDHLFGRYIRHDERQGDVGGTGLGLMIVREIVEAHGGSVGVESSPGRGSRFTVRLPCAS